MAFWRKPTNVVTIFHNPASPVSAQALGLLQSALRYNKTANPQPANFELELIEPPMGMTGTQRATMLRSLMMKEDAERAEKRRQLNAEREKAASEGKVLEEVKKEDVDWNAAPTLPKFHPPLVAWWQADDVVSGSLDDVKALIERLKKDEWDGKGDQGLSLSERVKHWLS